MIAHTETSHYYRKVESVANSNAVRRDRPREGAGGPISTGPSTSTGIRSTSTFRADPQHGGGEALSRQGAERPEGRGEAEGDQHRQRADLAELKKEGKCPEEKLH